MLCVARAIEREIRGLALFVPPTGNTGVKDFSINYVVHFSINYLHYFRKKKKKLMGITVTLGPNPPQTPYLTLINITEEGTPRTRSTMSMSMYRLLMT